MAVELTLTDCRLALTDWDELLLEHACDELTAEEQLFSQDGRFLMLVAGSVRGVALSHQGAGWIQAELFLLASQADWRAALSLLHAASRRGGGTLAYGNGEVVGPHEPQLLPRRAVATFCAGVREIQEQAAARPNARVELPVGSFSLELGPTVLPETCEPAQVPALEAQLAERVARYARSYHGPTLVLGTPGGPDVRVGTWALVPTILNAGVQFVSLPGLSEGHFVPLERLVLALGPRAESVGEGRWFLPEVDPQREPDLLAGLIGQAVSPLAVEAGAGPAEPEPTGTLLPVIRPADWGGLASRLVQALCPLPESPVIAYGYDQPDRIHFQPATPALDAAALARLRERALANLRARVAVEGTSWRSTEEIEGEPACPAVFLTDEFAPSLVLLPEFIDEALRTLGTDTLAVGMPSIHVLWACDVGDAPLMLALAATQFVDARDASGTHLTPHLLVVEEGEPRAIIPNPCSLEADDGDVGDASLPDDAGSPLISATEVYVAGALRGVDADTLIRHVESSAVAQGMPPQHAARLAELTSQLGEVALADLADDAYGPRTMGRLHEAGAELAVAMHVSEGVRRGLREVLPAEGFHTIWTGDDLLPGAWKAALRERLR